MQRIVRGSAFVLVCAVAICQARSFAEITTWPSIRIGNDLGRFDWYVDIGWDSWIHKETDYGQATKSSELYFEPSVGCNIAVVDTTFRVYLGGTVGTALVFDNAQYSGQVNIDLGLGGGLEIPLIKDKISIIGEYMLGFWLTSYPDVIPEGATQPSQSDRVSYGFLNKPSLQLRYYIGPK